MDFIDVNNGKLLFILVSGLVLFFVCLKLLRHFFSSSRQAEVSEVFNVSSQHQLTVVKYHGVEYTLLLHKTGALLLDKKVLLTKHQSSKELDKPKAKAPALDFSLRSRQGKITSFPK